MPARARKSRPLTVTGAVMTPPPQKYSGRGGLAIRRTSDGRLRTGLQTLDLTGGGIVAAIGNCGAKESQSETAAARNAKVSGGEEAGHELVRALAVSQHGVPGRYSMRGNLC